MKRIVLIRLCMLLVPLLSMAVLQGADLTGDWKFDGGGDVYIRQIGDKVWWYGEAGPNQSEWSHVAYGTTAGRTIRLTWSDVPKGASMNNGTLQVEIVSETELVVRQETGGFLGTRLTRKRALTGIVPVLERIGPPEPALFKIRGYGSINHDAALLIDGALVAAETEWQDPAGVWWEDPGVYFIVDLGKKCRVSDIVLQADNNDDYRIEYSLDGTGYKLLLQVTDPMGEVGTGFDIFSTDAGTPGYIKALDFAKPVEARFLRISAKGGDNMFAITEIEVK